jgi:hypothetical protein
VPFTRFLKSGAAFFGWIPTAPTKPAKSGREAVSTAHLGRGDYPLMWITSGWPTIREQSGLTDLESVRSSALKAHAPCCTLLRTLFL